MKKILVVEDNEAVQALVRHYLRPLGADVYFTTSAIDGIRWAQKNKPELALIDFFLPEMDGITIANILKAGFNGPELIIMSSNLQLAHQIPEDIGFLKKPFTGSSLKAALFQASRVA